MTKLKHFLILAVIGEIHPIHTEIRTYKMRGVCSVFYICLSLSLACYYTVDIKEEPSKDIKYIGTLVRNE